MNNREQTSGNQQVLKKISELLKTIRSGNPINPSAINEFIEGKIKNNADIEIFKTLFVQLQKISEQMENMSWLNKHYRILHEFAQVCSKTLNERILLKKAYEMVSQVMPTDAFYIALYNEGDTHIQFVFMVDKKEIAPPMVIEFGENYTSKVIKTREVIHRKESKQSLEFDTVYGENEDDTNSCLFVPVIIDDHVKGVISAQSYVDFAYRKEHEELLQIIGTQVINSIETARLYEQIYKMSQTDELTGLKNHRAFHDELSKLINDGKKEITLVMIDSDNLKQVNDQYGHDIGDLYLKVLSEGIKSISSDEIEGYRYAGDEFMVMIKSKMNQDIGQLYERLKKYYSDNPITILNDQITLSISSGVAVYPKHGSTVDALKKAADQALYHAKEKGKNLMVMAVKG